MAMNSFSGTYYLLTLLAFCTLFSCNLTKNIPKGDLLYTGADVNIKDSTLTDGQVDRLEELTKGLPRPIPNSKFLGIPFQLILYNMGGDPDKEGFLRKFFRKIGQPPVLFSRVDLDFNKKVLESFLENNGYFRTEAIADTIVNKRKVHAYYTVDPGPLYTIENVEFETDSSTALGRAIADTYTHTLLKPGDHFNLEAIEEERTRIDAILKQQGYYYFNPEFLIVNADSTVGYHKTDMHLMVKNTTPDQARKPFIIDNVYIYSDYNLSTEVSDTLAGEPELYKGYFIIDPKDKFRNKLFPPVMLFDSGDVYNRNDHNLTLSRLINLDIFQFVKNRFEVSRNSQQDTGRLNVYYYLTPKPKKSLRTEISANTKSNNFIGTQLTLTFRNRNTFRAAEHLDIHANIGTEIQYGGKNQGYNTFKYGGGLRFTIPRFVAPFIDFNTTQAYVPKTIMSLDYSLLDRRKLYTLSSIKGEYGYSWKPNSTKLHELNPVSVNFVKAISITDKYLDSIATDPVLKHAIDTQFILGSNYAYTLNQMILNPKGNGIYFNALADVSGNLAGLLSAPNAQGKETLFGTPFAQYIKTQFDFRYYWALSDQLRLANRAIAGFGFPYGNSRQLPFIKQFFAGGNNSIRAFRSRSLGPGTYQDPRSDSLGFFPDQAGDIKLEFNTELRFRIGNYLEPALFVDAGNVWLYREDPNQPGGVFTEDFLKQLAVGTGIGLRIDLSILLLRLDVGIPLRKPWLPPGERWVIDEIDFGSKAWRRENIILNLAIGYPF